VTPQNSAIFQVAGYVLAGGASSRFGSDKALAQLAGETVLQRMVRLLSGVADFVRIVTTVDRYPGFREQTVVDRWPSEGALGGILTALHASRGPGYAWNVILSCDMPFLTSEWLSHMVERAISSDIDVLFPRSPSGDEPLCGCWRTAALPQLQAAFDEGVRKVTDAAARVRVEVLDETHWKRFDTAGRLFWNMNTRQDYEEAVRIWRTENE
jgi:molybdopterin-guanine dinucleotide biosynthesis protein A